MQAKSKIYLRKFEQENSNYEESTEQDVMDWFKRQTITIDLENLIDIQEIIHSKYGMYQFKVLKIKKRSKIFQDISEDDACQTEIQVWISYDNERPYKKHLILQLKSPIDKFYIHHYLLGIIFENSNTLTLINMFSKAELIYNIPFTFSQPMKEKQVLWLYNIIQDYDQFQDDKLTIFGHDNALENQPNMHYQGEDLDEVLFIDNPQQNIKFKILTLEGRAIKINADNNHAIIVQQLPEKEDISFSDDEEEEYLATPKQVVNGTILKHNITSHLSNMFRSLNQRESVKNMQTINIVNVDLNMLRQISERQVTFDQVSYIFKYFSVCNFTKFEIILVHDEDSAKRMYVLEKKQPKGLRIVEIEREVITPLIDNDLDVIDWNFDLDSHRLCLLYKNPQGKECVKVLPFSQIRKNATNHFGGDHSLNKYLDLVSESELTFKDEFLSQLDGKVYPIQSYINYDNFVFIGIGNTLCIKNLAGLCDKNDGWNVQVRQYENPQSENSYYSMIDNFDQDIFFFFMTHHKLYVRYQDAKKQTLIIKDGNIVTKDMFLMENSLPPNQGKIIKVRELLEVKEQTYIIMDIQDPITSEINICVIKGDMETSISKIISKIKLEDQNIFNVVLNRETATLAVIYQDYMCVFKIIGGKNEPLVTIQFKGALQDLDIQNIESYQMNSNFIYILNKDLLYIVNMTEQKVEQTQRLGTNVKHFLIFEDKYIYWLEKNDYLQQIKFDYFDPYKQTQLIECTLLSGANQLNQKQLITLSQLLAFRKIIRFDSTAKRMSILFSTTKIHLYPALHLNYLELIGYDKRCLFNQEEITQLKNMKLYLLTKNNCVKVWDIISSKLIENRHNNNCEYSKYQTLYKLGDNMYVLKKMLNESLGEYLVVETSVSETDDEFIVTPKTKIIFQHSKCSEVRGIQESLRFAEDLKHFVAKAIKNGRNLYVVYKLLDKLDEQGYHIYDAVSIIDHDQDIFFSPNLIRFIEFDREEQVFKIQTLNLSGYSNQCTHQVNPENYRDSDYFKYFSPSQVETNRFSMRQTFDGRFKTLISNVEKQPDFEQANFIEKIMHKNENTIRLELKIESLQNRFNWMKSCQLTGNRDWPLVFCCDYTIVVIVDNHILKKYAVVDAEKKLIEISTVSDWDSLNAVPQFSNEPPKFYINHGVIFTKNLLFDANKEYYDNLNILYKMFNKRKQENFNIYPLTFDIESLYNVQFCSDLSAKVAQYMYRANKRYQKRKRVVFDFSLFNWLFVTKLKKIYKTKDIPYEVLKSACLSVYPKRQNILFYLNDVNLLSYVYGRMQIYHEDEGIERPFYIPYLKNRVGKTPLHYFLSNAKLTDQFLNYLADYPLNFYSENMSEIVPYLIIKGLQKTNYYLDKRFKTTPMLKTFDRERLKISQEIKFSFTGTNTYWFEDREQIAQNPDLFDDNEFQLPTKVSFLDIPNLVNQSSGKDLNIFTALRTTEQMDIFESEAVRAIIEYSWPITRKAIIRWMMIPSLAFLIFFMFYTSFVFPIVEDCFQEQQIDLSKDPSVVCRYNAAINNTSKITIVIFLLYFAAIEVIQAWLDASIYLSSPWNYLDLISIFFIFTTIIIDYLNIGVEIQRPLYAFATLIIWLKSLYYLRIFRNVGYLTSMIISVIQDMVYFFVILVMSLFAFGNSFYILSQANPDKESRFIQSYPEGLSFTFRLLLGDFETNKFGDDNQGVIWILFVVASLFLIVVLLNLLISIISESYNKIQLNAKNSMYKELASLIYDNYFLTDYELKAQKYIIIAKPDCEYIDDIIEERSKLIDPQANVDLTHTKNQEYIMDSITRLGDEMSIIKDLLVKQQEQQYKFMRDTINNTQSPPFNVRKTTDGDHMSQNLLPPQASLNAFNNRISFGFGDSLFGGSIHKKRRRGTQNSRGGAQHRLDTILQHDEEVEERQRKNTMMKRRIEDKFNFE